MRRLAREANNPLANQINFKLVYDANLHTRLANKTQDVTVFARVKTEVRKNDAESYPHSTRMTRICSEGVILDLAGSAMAYVHFAQMLYGADCKSGPSDPKIKPRK